MGDTNTPTMAALIKNVRFSRFSPIKNWEQIQMIKMLKYPHVTNTWLILTFCLQEMNFLPLFLAMHEKID